MDGHSLERTARYLTRLGTVFNIQINVIGDEKVEVAIAVII
jgi:hypothetical protein